MRRVRRKAVNKEKVFGCDLLEHLSTTAQEVPLVLRCCSEFVEQHGIVDGIYRLSGVSSNIQKLRSEFEADGSLDLHKDVYLQDIHCVSSLCKAYFRELPNPLLTYELYDKFAEAVAIQLEKERLVKIRDVLKELPPPHYRTLEFLMRHLVKMASFSSETNMHTRNLAIVWAPNLLRSKDIETSGFNGTAAFMEVRVQSIVVEFILSHVAQLFPEEGESLEWSKSLPSPSATTNQADGFFKPVSTQVSIGNIGNISPGDGPLPIRPYHAVIEGTDKRKGSLKGRKWMSIFNIGGRFQDQRRRHKHSAKEKGRQTLRPARSMDSLSSPLHAKEGSMSPAQTPPNLVPVAQSSPAGGGSEYAITFRQGTGLVVGGTQGTYTALDPDGMAAPDSDGVQARSPALSSKAGRRAAMHITGPTLVTVPLHITSNLARGLLQVGGSDRVVHRSRQTERGDAERRTESSETMKDVTQGEGDRTHSHQDQLSPVDDKCVGVSPEVPEDNQQGAAEEDQPRVRISAQIVDEELSGYVQENFDFLDQMDCSVLDHMDHSAPYQVREFSVEPPGHNEYELMEQNSHVAPVLRSHLDPGSDSHRRLSISTHRHTKSLSLPYMTAPACPPEEPGSEDEDEDYSSDGEDDELMKSLPADFLFNSCGDQEEECCEQRGGEERDEEEEEEDEEKDEEKEQEEEDKEQEKECCEQRDEEEEEEGQKGEEKDEMEDRALHVDEEELDADGADEEERRNHRAADLDQFPEEDDEDFFPPPPPDCLDFPPPIDEDEENFAAAAGGDEEQRDALELPPYCVEAEESVGEMLADGPQEEEAGSCDGGDEETARQEDGDKSPHTDEEEVMDKGDELCHGNTWDELEEVICELMEDDERRREEEETPGQETDMKELVAADVTDKESSRSDVQLLSPAAEVLDDDGETWTPEAVTRMLVVSRPPKVKVYQAKAVPVVPPKPQHCKIAAMTLRQRRREAGEQTDEDRETKAADRNSPVSMCFDEAVAIATMRRERKERLWERGGDPQ